MIFRIFFFKEREAITVRSKIPAPSSSHHLYIYPESIFGTPAAWIRNEEVLREHIPNNDVSLTQTVQLDSTQGIKGLGQIPLKELTPDMFETDRKMGENFWKRRLLTQRAKSLEARKMQRESAAVTSPLQERSYLQQGTGFQWWKSYVPPNPSSPYPLPWYNYNGKQILIFLF